MIDYSIGSSIRNGIIFLSTLVLIAGAGILGASLWTIVTISSFQSIIGSSAGIFVSVYLMLAIGSIMFFFAFFGCVAALCENKVMLTIYASLLFVVFLIEVVGSVLAFVYYPVARNAAQTSIALYNEDVSIKTGWDDIQGVLLCCGINSYVDWRQLEQYPVLPRSCCVDKIDACNDQSLTLFKQGCDTSIGRFFHIIGGIGFGILAVEILAIAVTGCALRKLY